MDTLRDWLEVVVFVAGYMLAMFAVMVVVLAVSAVAFFAVLGAVFWLIGPPPPPHWESIGHPTGGDVECFRYTGDGTRYCTDGKVVPPDPPPDILIIPTGS